MALASILISTMTNYEAALVMEDMISSSASDLRLAPAASHLKDLFDVLAPKLNRAGFLDEVLAWIYLWSNHPDVSPISQIILQGAGDEYPDAESIRHLVEAFADVCRVGEEAKNKRVVVTARLFVPWLSAFAKWSTGVPPMLSTNKGGVIFENPSSPAEIIFAEEGEAGFDNLRIKIEIVSSGPLFPVLDQVAEFMRPEAVGMVGIGNYAKRLFQRQNLGTDFDVRTVVKVLPFALLQVRDLCWFDDNFVLGFQHDANVTSQAGNPFPASDTIENTANQYLRNQRDGLRTIDPLRALGPGLLLSDIGIVKMWQEGRSDDFTKAIAPIVADILALSLFEGCLDTVKVYYCRNRRRSIPSCRDWDNAVYRILSTGTSQKCSVKSIIDFSLGLLHHDLQPQPHNSGSTWVASSFHGQVVFPKVFFDGTIQKDGYLELHCIPGVLSPDEQAGRQARPVSLARSQTPHLVRYEHVAPADPIVCAVNLYRDHRARWHASTSEDCILVGMGWTANNAALNPFGTLQSLAYGLFPECEHDPDMKVASSPTDCTYRSPVDDRLNATPPDTTSSITIFPVAGDQRLRMLALSSIEWRLQASGGKALVVINNGACFNCLLGCCYRSGCRFLIL